MTGRGIIFKGSSTLEGGPSVRLWVIALVFAVFSALFFIMAMIDLRRLEGMLLDHRIKKAQYVIEGVERASEERFDRLMPMGDNGTLSPALSIQEAAFPAEESYAKSLIDLAKYIGYQEEIHSLSRENLLEVAESGNFSTIALLGRGGEARIQTGPLPPALLPEIETFVKGGQEVTIHLSDETDKPDSLSFIGIRRQDAKGLVILVLDAKGLHHWRLKVAVQKGIEDLRWVGGVIYFVVEDSPGHPIAGAGNVPTSTVPNRVATIVTSLNSRNVARQQQKSMDTSTMEFALPFQLHSQTIGTARVGLEVRADQYVIDERRHIFLWTAVMILIGLFAMGLLYQTQNRHLGKLQAIRERLHQAERLSSLTNLAARVAHEIRNPLNGISLATQRLRREFSPGEGKNKEEFERITYILRDEIRRLNAIIEDFLSLSRSDRLNLQPQPIVDLLRRTVFLVREEALAMGIQIDAQLTDFSPLILMDASKMEQALLNIVRNAMEAITGEGSITISIENSGKSRASIKVQDSGAGIRKEKLSQIFDPYYTTKEGGVGIGLCIAHEIIVAHGGEILVFSEAGKGTVCEIRLPLEPG